MPGFDCNRFPDLKANESVVAFAEGYKCDRCLQVLDNAVDTPCGHTFCYECLNKWLAKPQTSKKCPECGETLATRKRSRSNNEVIIGGNVLVYKNRRTNKTIGKLKITCDYEWNGCTEVCPLKSLSTHLKTCHYRLCQTCGLSVGLVRDDHNCIESFKKALNECETKSNEWKQKAKELETKLRISEEKALNLELKCKQTDDLYKEMVYKYQHLETSLNTSEVGEELVIGLQIIPKCLLFGKCVINVTSIEFNEYNIVFNNFVPNGNQSKELEIIKISFYNIECLKACTDSSLPMLCIKLNLPPHYYVVRDMFYLNNSFINKCHFNVHSIDPTQHWILIELNEPMEQTFLIQLREKCRNNFEFKYETIDSKIAQHMLSRAKLSMIESRKS